MQKHTAQILSILTEPVFVFLIAIAIIQFQFGLDDNAGLSLLFLFIGGVSLFAPAVWQYLHARRENIDFSQMQRNSILLGGVFGYAFASMLFGSVIATSVFWTNLAMMLTVFFACFYLVNHYFDKASLHVGVLVLWSMILIDLVSIGFSLALILVLPVTWARLYLHKHTWAQIMWGMTIGLTIGLLAWIAL